MKGPASGLQPGDQIGNTVICTRPEPAEPRKRLFRKEVERVTFRGIWMACAQRTLTFDRDEIIEYDSFEEWKAKNA